MNSLEFSIPYDGNPESLPKIFALNRLNDNKVREVYLAGPQQYSPATRIMPRITLNEFINIINQIHAEGIGVNLLLNSTCEGSDWYEPEVVKYKIDYIGLLHEQYGLEAITIANPIYIQEVRKNFPQIEICASVLGSIDSVQRAIYYDTLGVDIIVPDTSINRDLKLLMQIKDAVSAKLKLMPNLGCVYRCPFQRFHGPYISHKSMEVFADNNNAGDETPFFQKRCSEMITGRHHLVFQSAWIRPEDLRRYSHLTNRFKIAGRRNKRWARISRAYIEESWDGNLLELMDASLKYFGINHHAYVDNKKLGQYDLFDRLTSCDKDCDACGYCQQLAAELVEEKVCNR
jgi:collagenase-like PrtC family protease